MKNATKLRDHTLALCECAMAIALSFALDWICKIIPFPDPWINGGGINLQAVPLVFISFRRGNGWGIICGLANAGLQMLTGFYLPGAGLFSAFVCIMLDYVLAFTVYGVAQFFANAVKSKGRLFGYAFGTLAVYMLRFICSFLSGSVIWAEYGTAWGIENIWLYSFCYNISYMLPNGIIAAIIIVLICRKIDPKTLKPIKAQA